MNSRMSELLNIVGCDLVANRSMTTDEILECIHCYVDDEGEIIDADTGKATGIWWEEVAY